MVSLVECNYGKLLLTTVRTLPGFWMRSAFTTWNTSTMPSVLQHSVALMNEQNTPHRLTVSLCAVSGRKWKHSLHMSNWKRGPSQLAHLPWTTMGLFPVLLCTTNTCSMTAMMAGGEVHRPSEVQQDIWN